MKALFLVFHGFSAHNGISKKIFYQVEALRHNSVETELCWLDIKEGCHLRKVDEKVIENFGSGIKAKIRKRICYDSVTRYVIDNKIELVYIRSAHNANPFITRMVKKMHHAGVKIVMEIPTYPYEGQFKEASLKNKARLYLDILCRQSMANYLDKIVTFANVPTIFGRPTISISNGIDFSQISLKETHQTTTLQLL
ncbi:MAG: glycosyltransferase family 1 protein, partial [Rikenellaceae bacterium]